MRQNIKIDKTEPNKGILNYSHLLDAPAGKHGFVKRKKEHLYFEDGTRARFLGFNIAARSNTPDHLTAEKLAERFASMGVNMIRLHAADAPIGETPCSWSSCKEAPLIDYTSGTSRRFHPEGLDRFDYLVAKLKEKGIYLHIDLIVARAFLEADELNYPGKVASCMKRYGMYNQRLIELQKEYAKELLCHVNPYTGLALIDDPAVVVIQINNEDSAIKGNTGADMGEEMRPYREEVQKRFNEFLLSKYHTRENLKAAWTKDGVCVLKEEEDPILGTVEGVEGSFYQPNQDPAAEWDKDAGVPRYADFMEFGIERNRSFYQDFKNYLHSLGAKVPIVTSNLIAGAADVYGHIDGDIMENNSYFNHPILPVVDDAYMVAGPAEYVTSNPLTMQQYIGSMGTTILSLASVAVTKGKPFMLSEWNEYGEHPFHSTAFVHTVAYACLNDWDGLILYNYHTSEHWDDQPDDEILSVFDVYNDPAVIMQWGFMASVFLKGLVSTAKNVIDLVYTKEELKTLPTFFSMPMTMLPYLSSMRNVFLDGGEHYAGNADVAVNAGFLNAADLSDAKHAVYYAWSDYRDAFRRYPEGKRLLDASGTDAELAEGVTLGEQNLVFHNIRQQSNYGDYREVAKNISRAMRSWEVLPEGTGYVDGKLVSDTGELVFDPEQARFTVMTPYCGYFSGAPKEMIRLSEQISVAASNERITLALIAKEEKELSTAKEFLFTAMGTTGMDQTEFGKGIEMMGFPLTAVKMKGKLFAETMEGTITVKATAATLTYLDSVGNVIKTVEEESCDGEVRFTVDSSIPSIQYHISVK